MTTGRITDAEYLKIQEKIAADYYRKHIAEQEADRATSAPYKMHGKPLNEPPYTPQPRARVLQQALDLTMGERNERYGDPTDNHSNIAQLWRAYLGCRSTDRGELDAEDVMIMMALLKIARIGQRLDRANTDSYIDACAYIAMAVEPYTREPALQEEG